MGNPAFVSFMCSVMRGLSEQQEDWRSLTLEVVARKASSLRSVKPNSSLKESIERDVPMKAESC